MAVIPVHNEALTLAPLVTTAQHYLPVIVVDDASDDHSGALAAAAGATVLTLSSRQGKGAALRHGFRTALHRGASAIVTLDGDGQHDPRDIPHLLAASQRWPDSIIIGNRLAAAAAMLPYRLHAIRVASFWISWMTGCTIADTQSGFRVYPAQVLRTLPLKHGGFLLESEALLQASRAGWSIRERPIHAVYRPGQPSHYRPVRDGGKAVMYLLYHGVRFWPTHLRQCWKSWRGQQRQDWRDLRRRTWVAGRATGLLPMLGLITVAQLFLRHLGLDLLTPMIRWVYDHRLLYSPMVKRESAHAPQRSRWEYL